MLDSSQLLGETLLWQSDFSSVSSRQRSARWHSAGSASAAHRPQVAQVPAHFLRMLSCKHVSGLAWLVQWAFSSSRPPCTLARCSAQFVGHDVIMYVGLRVHSPWAAHPAHCSGSPAGLTTIFAYDLAHSACMKPECLWHSPDLARPSHSTSLLLRRPSAPAAKHAVASASVSCMYQPGEGRGVAGACGRGSDCNHKNYESLPRLRLSVTAAPRCGVLCSILPCGTQTA